MDTTGDTGKATAPERAPAPEAEAATAAPYPASSLILSLAAVSTSKAVSGLPRRRPWAA